MKLPKVSMFVACAIVISVAYMLITLRLIDIASAWVHGLSHGEKMSMIWPTIIVMASVPIVLYLVKRIGSIVRSYATRADGEKSGSGVP